MSNREREARRKEADRAVADSLARGHALTTQDLIDIYASYGLAERTATRNLPSSMRNNQFTRETGVPVRFNRFSTRVVFSDRRRSLRQTNMDLVVKGLGKPG